MKLFGMCIDKRVIAGVVAAAALWWWLAPGAFAASWPLLLVAICPLSMLLMMKAMNQMEGQSHEPSQPGTSPAPSVTDIDIDAATDLDARRN